VSVLSVCLSVCRSVGNEYFRRMAEAIDMPFGVVGRVGPRNHVLDGRRH